MIRLLVVDDHRMFRQGLSHLVATQSDLRVVAEAANYIEAIAACRTVDLDVALVDLSMPGRDGVQLMAQLKVLHPTLRCMVLSMHWEESHAVHALRAGAHGYLTKDQDAEELFGAIRRVAAGGRYICPAVAETITMAYSKPAGSVPTHTTLSHREFRIFEMLVSGKRGYEIANELSISEKTVSTHKAHVFRKINVQSSAELVQYAIRHQLLTV